MRLAFIFILLIIFSTGCDKTNPAKIEMEKICHLAKLEKCPTNYQSEEYAAQIMIFIGKIEKEWKTAEVKKIFQDIAMADPKDKRSFYTEELKRLKIDPQNCKEFLNLFP